MVSMGCYACSAGTTAVVTNVGGWGVQCSVIFSGRSRCPCAFLMQACNRRGISITGTGSFTAVTDFGATPFSGNNVRSVMVVNAAGDLLAAGGNAPFVGHSIPAAGVVRRPRSLQVGISSPPLRHCVRHLAGVRNLDIALIPRIDSSSALLQLVKRRHLQSLRLGTHIPRVRLPILSSKTRAFCGHVMPPQVSAGSPRNRHLYSSIYGSSETTLSRTAGNAITGQVESSVRALDDLVANTGLYRRPFGGSSALIASTTSANPFRGCCSCPMLPSQTQSQTQSRSPSASRTSTVTRSQMTTASVNTYDLGNQ